MAQYNARDQNKSQGVYVASARLAVCLRTNKILGVPAYLSPRKMPTYLIPVCFLPHFHASPLIILLLLLLLKLCLLLLCLTSACLSATTMFQAASWHDTTRSDNKYKSEGVSCWPGNVSQHRSEFTQQTIVGVAAHICPSLMPGTNFVPFLCRKTYHVPMFCWRCPRVFHRVSVTLISYFVSCLSRCLKCCLDTYSPESVTLLPLKCLVYSVIPRIHEHRTSTSMLSGFLRIFRSFLKKGARGTLGFYDILDYFLYRLFVTMQLLPYRSLSCPT